jgi:hypothetical protein
MFTFSYNPLCISLLTFCIILSLSFNCLRYTEEVASVLSLQALPIYQHYSHSSTIGVTSTIKLNNSSLRFDPQQFASINGSIESSSTSTNYSSSNILLYIIYHDEASNEIALKCHSLFPAFTMPIFIKSTVFFESIVYRKILPSRYNDWKDKIYVGIISYKVMESLTSALNTIFELSSISDLIDQNSDISSYLSKDVISSSNRQLYDLIPFPYPQIDWYWGDQYLLPQVYSIIISLRQLPC